jgi:hypothetical protein
MWSSWTATQLAVGLFVTCKQTEILKIFDAGLMLVLNSLALSDCCIALELVVIENYNALYLLLRSFIECFLSSQMRKLTPFQGRFTSQNVTVS